MRYIIPLVSFALLAAISSSVPAKAQCAEGKTASGECVDPGLAAGARQSAIIFSQPKISQTALPLLPNDDRSFRYPNGLIPDPQTASPTGTVSPSPGAAGR